MSNEKLKSYQVTDKAGPWVAGQRSPGVGEEIELTHAQAATPLRNGELIDPDAESKETETETDPSSNAGTDDEDSNSNETGNAENGSETGGTTSKSKRTSRRSKGATG